MGGFSGMRGSMFDDDEGGASHFFGGGMPGGMPNGRSQTGPSRARQESAPAAPSEITRPLKVTLEELNAGANKRLKVGRKLLNGTTEDKILEIQVHPGWKSGTKIRFPKAGNEQPNGDSQDLVFVIEEKPHDRFQRDGNDLITTVQLPLVDALTGGGGRKTVEALDGRKLQVPIPSGIVKPGTTTTVTGEGMPIRKEGSAKKKGDLIVKWDVAFPDRLTASQKEGLRKILS